MRPSWREESDARNSKVAQPTDLEQLMLEYINEARLNPMSNAARYLTGYEPLRSNDPDIQNALDFFKVKGSVIESAYKALVPVAPVAWNDNLADAAHDHSQAMIRVQQQTHQVQGEPSLIFRLGNANYNGWINAAENVYAFAESVLHAHAGFMVDWGAGPDGIQDPAGHRFNIMNSV